MKMNMLRVFGIVMLVILFSSCVRNKSGAVQNEVPANANVFEVKEVVQGDTYTYMNVKEGMADKWVAVTKQEDVNTGDVYYYDNELEMSNFHSKEIDRTFDVIYFVSHISKTPMGQAQNPMGGGMMPGMGGDVPAHSGRVTTEEHSEISLEKSGNEITVAQVFDNRDNYEGKEIEIRGVVVKVNKSVMGKNWIHIQDGTTAEDGSYDLTITSQDVAEVDDEVTLKGKVTLNKDFGAGYFYEVIMEEATLLSSSVNL